MNIENLINPAHSPSANSNLGVNEPQPDFLESLQELVSDSLRRRHEAEANNLANNSSTNIEKAISTESLSEQFESGQTKGSSSVSVKKNKTTDPSLPKVWDDFTLEKLEMRINRSVGKAIAHYQLIEEGDRILVAISGGKDSWAMLEILNKLRKRAPVKFDLVAVNIDQGYAGFRQDVVEDYVRDRGYEYHMEFFNIAKIIEEKSEGATPCSLCSRLRRGALYGLADKYGCNKIALGHHADDFIETLLLNTFFIGRLAAMAPKLLADDQKHVVIRPLVYVTEGEIKAYVKKMKFPIVCCQCPLMCGETVHGDYKRRMIKKMIEQLEVAIPHIRSSIMSSMTNIRPSHLLDQNLWDFSQNAAPIEGATSNCEATT